MKAGTGSSQVSLDQELLQQVTPKSRSANRSRRALFDRKPLFKVLPVIPPSPLEVPHLGNAFSPIHAHQFHVHAISLLLVCFCFRNRVLFHLVFYDWLWSWAHNDEYALGWCGTFLWRVVCVSLAGFAWRGLFSLELDMISLPKRLWRRGFILSAMQKALQIWLLKILESLVIASQKPGKQFSEFLILLLLCIHFPFPITRLALIQQLPCITYYQNSSWRSGRHHGDVF